MVDENEKRPKETTEIYVCNGVEQPWPECLNYK
jgi:hypothetical protein